MIFMPVLSDVSDEKILSYLNQVNENLAEAISEAVDDGTRERILMAMIAKYSILLRNEPEFDKFRIGNVRSLDAMLPDNIMTAQDVILMASGIGAQTVRYILEHNPRIASACGFDHQDEYPEHYPFNKIAARGMNNMQPESIIYFVQEFRKNYTGARNKLIRIAVDKMPGQSEVAGQMAASGISAEDIRKLIKDDESREMIFNPIRESALDMIRQNIREGLELDKSCGFETDSEYLNSDSEIYAGIPKFD